MSFASFAQTDAVNKARQNEYRDKLKLRQYTFTKELGVYEQRKADLAAGLKESERALENAELQETVKTVSELDKKTVDSSKLDYLDDNNLDNATEATLPHLNTTITLAKDPTTDETIVATVEEILQDDEINDWEDQVFEFTNETSTEGTLTNQTFDRPNNKRLKFPQDKTVKVENKRNPKTLNVEDKVDKNDVVYILYLDDIGRDE